MAINNLFQSLREKVRQAMLRAGVSMPNADDENVSVRADGVVEFNVRWQIHGDDDEGSVAHWSDRDDVLEFGVLERNSDGTSTNVVHATLIFDNDIAQLNVMSERYSDLNFDTTIVAPLETPGHIDEVLSKQLEAMLVPELGA